MKYFLTLFFLFTSTPVLAGGPFSVVDVDGTGVASAWDNSQVITLNIEAGTCGPFSNSELQSKLEEDMNQWTGIDNIGLTIEVDSTEIGIDLTADNYTEYFVSSNETSDGINPVIFDDDGSITEELFGTCASLLILGFAGPDGYSDDDGAIINDGQIFINCRCLEGNTPCVVESDCSIILADYNYLEGDEIVFTEDDLDFTAVHEVGHMLGLDHSQTNQDIAEEISLTTDCEDGTVADCGAIPTMFPVSVAAADQLVPSRDDEVALLNLYGVSQWIDETCTVSGSLLDSDGNPLRCADVQAITDDPADTIAQVSGVYATPVDTNEDGDTTDAEDCEENCGDFFLRGLDPAKSYTIYVKPIDPRWVETSGINPCSSDQLSTIEVEEIGAIASCSAGSTTDLGDVTTESTGGISDSDTGTDSGGSSSGDTYFEPIIGCSLHMD